MPSLGLSAVAYAMDFGASPIITVRKVPRHSHARYRLFALDRLEYPQAQLVSLYNAAS
jgi:hypothetical protein